MTDQRGTEGEGPGRRRVEVIGWIFACLVFTSCGGPEREPSPSTANAVEVCTVEARGLPAALDRIDRMLAERLESEGIPGLAAGLVCGDSLVWAEGYGVMALDDPEPVTSRTRFRIASITKVFTATAVMQLAESGAIALDDPVDRHLPWFRIERPEGTGDAPVTIRQLLTHTAGMPRDSRLTDFDRLFQPDRADAIAALPSQELQAPPGEVSSYSNLGYGVLGEVIAETSGGSYAGYLEQSIFQPLGMEETLVHPREEDRTAWGHGPRPPRGPRPRAGFWNLGFATPAGGMASSVEELSAFIRLHLTPYVGSASPVLSSGRLEEMHAVQHMIDPERGGSGLGWGVEISRDQHLIYHGGELPEQTSFMLIDLRTRIGSVVLTNAQGVDANGMAQDMLRIAREEAVPSGSFPDRPIPPGES